MSRRIDPDYLVRTSESPVVRSIKNAALRSLNLTAESRVLDVGCGPAIDTIEIARMTAPTGFVIGIDSDPEMVAIANQRSVREGVGAQSHHLVGNAASLAFNTGEFDACFCERVMQHLTWADAHAAAREMVRVVRPEGRIAVLDTDWGTLSIASENVWLERRVVAEHVLSFPNPFAGRFLLSMFRAAGLTQLSVQTFDLQLTFEALEFLLNNTIRRGIASNRISIEESRRFHSELRVAKDYGIFFAHVALVAVTGSTASSS